MLKRPETSQFMRNCNEEQRKSTDVRSFMVYHHHQTVTGFRFIDESISIPMIQSD